MIEELKTALAKRQKRHIIDSSRLSAAVVVPIFRKDNECYLLFTERTDTVKNHKGQISFPGGACEAKDGTPVNTALRECAEEVGLTGGSVEILGELDDEITVTSSFVITPFVAFVSSPDEIKVDPREVKETIEIPVSALQDKDSWREETKIMDGQSVTTYFYNYQGKVIWGATARILNKFLDVFNQVADKIKCCNG
ncbi:MAG: CoA pyrophosphatase [Chloroflexota bacterium]